MKSQTLHLVVLGAALASWGCAALNPEQARTYDLGIQAQNDECWSEAISHFRQIVAEQPRFDPTWLDIAACKFKIGLVEESTVDLQNFLATRSPNRAQRARAFFQLGTCHVERARVWRNSNPEESRILFAVALDTLERAWENGSMDYDTAHWIGYVNLQLERVDDAADALRTCEELEPDRLEHQALQAVAEDSSQFPGNSLTTFLRLADSDRSKSLGLLYEHLADIYPDLAEAHQKHVLDTLKAYRDANFVTSTSIEALLRRVETERQARILRAKLDEFRTRLASLEANKQYSEALQVIEDSRADLSESIDHDELLNDTRDRWSRALENSATQSLDSRDRQELQAGLKDLRKAIELTTAPLRRIVLQQKLELLQVSLNRAPPLPKILSAQTLLKSSEFHQALKELEQVELEELAEGDRESFHYLLGTAYYNVGRWMDAANALQEVHTPSFWNVRQMRGIACWRTGKREKALEDLSLVEVESRTDESLRILGHHYLSQDEHALATENLGALGNSSPHDLDALQRALTFRGMNEGAEGRWKESVESLRAARRVIESQLNRRGPRVYLELGRAYWHIDDLERAETTIRDLLDMDLDDDEKTAVREAYLFRALLSYRTRAFSSAYEDFRKFLDLGGDLPEEWRDSYNRVVAVFTDYLPLAAGNRWEYRSLESDESMEVQITRQEIGNFVVEITVNGETALEDWNVGASFLHQNGGVGKRVIPIRLSSPDGPYTSVKYRSSSTLFTSAIMDIGQTVTLANGKNFSDCIKVQTSSERESVPVIVRYLAPAVGEVRREIFEADRLVETWELEEFTVRGES